MPTTYSQFLRSQPDPCTPSYGEKSKSLLQCAFSNLTSVYSPAFIYGATFNYGLHILAVEEAFATACAGEQRTNKVVFWEPFSTLARCHAIADAQGHNVIYASWRN